jgi:hypothetical protein
MTTASGIKLPFRRYIKKERIVKIIKYMAIANESAQEHRNFGTCIRLYKMPVRYRRSAV